MEIQRLSHLAWVAQLGGGGICSARGVCGAPVGARTLNWDWGGGKEIAEKVLGGVDNCN